MHPWHHTLASHLLRQLRCVCVVAALATQASLKMAGQEPAPSPSAQSLLDLENADRARQGLGSLHWDAALARAALAHAEAVGASAQLEHQYAGEATLLLRAANAGAHLSAVGENLLRGTPRNVTGVEQSWLSSPIHRANLLNPAFDLAGIALRRSSAGEFIVVEDFGRAADPTDLQATDQTLLRSLRAHGLLNVQTSASARAICQQHLQSPSPNPPATVVQWDGPEPTSLPSALSTLLAHQRFQYAELGTCPGAESPRGFSTTRVTLLLR